MFIIHAYAEDMHFGFLDMLYDHASCIVLRVRQVSPKEGWMSTLNADTCYLFVLWLSITLSNWYETDLHFCLRDVVVHYMNYVCPLWHQRRQFNLTHIWSKQTKHVITAFLHNFHAKCLNFLQGKASFA